MKSLSKDISDDALIKLIDEWAGLMEAEDYEAAFQFTEQVPEMKWTPALYKKVIKKLWRLSTNSKGNGPRHTYRYHTKKGS